MHRLTGGKRICPEESAKSGFTASILAEQNLTDPFSPRAISDLIGHPEHGVEQCRDVSNAIDRTGFRNGPYRVGGIACHRPTWPAPAPDGARHGWRGVSYHLMSVIAGRYMPAPGA